MARTVEAGRAVLKLLLDDKELNKKFAETQRRVRNVARSVRSAGLIIGGLGATIAAPLGLAINQAAEAQEVFSKFSTVFGENEKAVKAWGDEFAGQVGRSRVETAKFLASFQDLLVPIGFEPGAAEGFSKQLVTLATDLASFNNMNDADVVRDLQAALTGSGEVMKKYGVLVSEAAVKQELLNRNMDPRHATEVEKAQARLNIIMAGTTAAQGDATRTAGSFTNQMKALRARIADAGVEIGTLFLPTATRLVEMMIGAVGVVADFVSEHQRLVVVVGVAGAALVAIGATLATIGGVVSTATVVVGGLSTALGFLGGVLTFLAAHPIVAALLVIGGVVLWLTDGFGLLNDKVEETGDALNKVAGIKGSANSAGARGQELAKQQQALQQQIQAQVNATPARSPQMPAQPSKAEQGILRESTITNRILLDVLTAIQDSGFIAGTA